MKCPRCGHDSKYKERPGRVCPSCRGGFAFEPREGDPLPDLAWKSAIDWVSSSGTVRFTAANLHHAVARRVKRRSVAAVVGIAAGIGFAVLTFIGLGNRAWGFAACSLALSAGAFFFAAIARRRFPPALALTRSSFQDLFNRWRAIHGTPPGLIEPRATARPPDAALAQELESYSFDRAVICDNPETVDLLLGNDFHFENNCAVLTDTGYPEHAAPTIRKMLLQNPRLEVFALHDATIDGCGLPERLRQDPQWFGGRDIRVFDVALRPAQAMKHRGLHFGESRYLPTHLALPRAEQTWLARQHMELAALRPEQIIKRLFRTMQQLPAAHSRPALRLHLKGGSEDVAAFEVEADDSDTVDADVDSFG